MSKKNAGEITFTSMNGVIVNAVFDDTTVESVQAEGLKLKVELPVDPRFKSSKYEFFKVNPHRARYLKLAHTLWHDTTDDHKERCVDRLFFTLPASIECSRLRALEFFGWRRTPGRSKPARRAMAKLAARRGRRG